MARSGETAGIGIVGVGNLGAALVAGWLRGDVGAQVDLALPLLVYDKDDARIRGLVAQHGERVRAVGSVVEMAGSADIILVAVKPQDLDDVMAAVGAAVGSGQSVVSTAAGAGLERLRASLGAGPDLYRIMPNLAVALGEGVVALAPEPGTDSGSIARVAALFAGMGAVEVLPESLFDAVTAVTGSGPGFLALVLEGLEDGAVRAGLPRAVARRFVRQTARGTAGLLLGDEGSAAALKDKVSSPGGTTIAGLAVLEDRGVRGALVRAVEAATQRGREL